MTSIIVPGYKSIIQNTVFGKDDGSSTEVLYLTRYRAPTKGEVVKRVINGVREGTMGGIVVMTPESIGEAPQKFAKSLQKLVDGDEKAIQGLKDCYDRGIITPGKSYIHALKGKIPNHILDYANGLINQMGAPLYPAILEKLKPLGDEYWNLRISYRGQRLLPREDIEKLFREQTTKSEDLAVEGHFLDYDNVIRLTNLLYPVFGDSKKIKLLRDDAEQVSIRMAFLTFVKWTGKQLDDQGDYPDKKKHQRRKQPNFQKIDGSIRGLPGFSEN